MARTTNAKILGATGAARLNKRWLCIRDSQFAVSVQWRPIAQFYVDPRLQWGCVFYPMGASGYANDAVGMFGSQPGARKQTFSGETLASPDNAYTNDLPGDLWHVVFSADAANFSSINNEVRIRTPIINGFGGVGDRFRVGNIVAALPNAVDDLDTGNLNCRVSTDDDATIAGATEQASPITHSFTGSRSNGGAIPHNATRVVEGGHGLITAPSGTYYQTQSDLFSFGGYVETGRTLAIWQRFMRRTDASGNWLPNRFAFLTFGEGGWKTVDHLAAGNNATHTRSDLSTWTGTRRWTDAAVTPILDWYQPEAWMITTDSNDIVDVDNQASRDAATANKTALVNRALSLRDIPVVLVDMWPNFFGVNMSTYSWAGDTSPTGPRRQAEFKWALNQALQDANPARVVRAPLGSEIHERLGLPGPSSYVQSHMPDLTHTGVTGALGPTSFSTMLLDLLEAGDAGAVGRGGLGIGLSIGV
jgi:hypothetical protein